MEFYLAPLEGLTTYIYRSAFHKYFGGVDKYYLAFVTSSRLGRRDMDEICPEHNEGMTVIPQIMTNRAEEFLSVSSQMTEFGYDTVNLNLGCPSGTVVAKKRGSGMMRDLELLERFLDEIFEKSKVKISIKTRLGISDLSEWDDVLAIYRKYPLQELIIHPRLQKEFYTGSAHRDIFADTTLQLANSGIPLCYNGDITSPAALEDYRTLMQHTLANTADADRIPVMIGRGLIRNPFLAEQLQTYLHADPKGEAAGTRSFTPAQVEVLKDFHAEVYEEYRSRMSGTKPVMFKMKDIWNYMSAGFPDSEKVLKKIRKANRFPEYESAVHEMWNLI